MKKLFFSLLVLSFAWLTGCQSPKTSTSSKLLRFNYSKGRGYDYELIMNMDRKSEAGTQQSDMTAYYSMEVSGEEDNFKTIKTRYERFKMSFDINGMGIAIDTDQPFTASQGDTSMKNSISNINRFFGAIKNQQFVLKVNTEGKIVEITGLSQMATSIADTLGLQGPARQQMIQLFGQRFNEDAIKEQMERFLFIFPDKEVKVGDSWTKNNLVKGVMAANYTSVYKVTEIEGDMVTIEENSTIGSSDPQNKMEGKIIGELVIDSRTGLVVKANQDIKAKTSGKEGKIDIIAKTRIKGVER
jgi:hypothetical protein